MFEDINVSTFLGGESMCGQVMDVANQCFVCYVCVNTSMKHSCFSGGNKSK